MNTLEKFKNWAQGWLKYAGWVVSGGPQKAADDALAKSGFEDEMHKPLVVVEVTDPETGQTRLVSEAEAMRIYEESLPPLLKTSDAINATEAERDILIGYDKTDRDGFIRDLGSNIPSRGIKDLDVTTVRPKDIETVTINPTIKPQRGFER